MPPTLDQLAPLLRDDEDIPRFGQLMVICPRSDFGRSALSQFLVGAIFGLIALGVCYIGATVEVSKVPEEQRPFELAMWGLAAACGIVSLYGIGSGAARSTNGLASIGRWWLFYERGMAILNQGKLEWVGSLDQLEDEAARGQRLLKDHTGRSLPLPGGKALEIFETLRTLKHRITPPSRIRTDGEQHPGNVAATPARSAERQDPDSLGKVVKRHLNSQDSVPFVGTVLISLALAGFAIYQVVTQGFQAQDSVGVFAILMLLSAGAAVGAYFVWKYSQKWAEIHEHGLVYYDGGQTYSIPWKGFTAIFETIFTLKLLGVGLNTNRQVSLVHSNGKCLEIGDWATDWQELATTCSECINEVVGRRTRAQLKRAGTLRFGHLRVNQEGLSLAAWESDQWTGEIGFFNSPPKVESQDFTWAELEPILVVPQSIRGKQYYEIQIQKRSGRKPVRIYELQVGALPNFQAFALALDILGHPLQKKD